MPIFVAAGAAAAYSYYKKRSSHFSEGGGGDHAEAEEGGCSCSASCDCKAAANDPPSSEACGEVAKTHTCTGPGMPEEEDDRPAPLLQKWNRKYGNASARKSGGRSPTSGENMESVEGETSPHSMSVRDAESCASNCDADGITTATAAPSDTIGIKERKPNDNAAADGSATLLQSWNERYPHLAKKTLSKQRRQQRFDGPTGKMVRNFLAKKRTGPGNESSTEREERKTNFLESEQKENASSGTVQGSSMENDSLAGVRQDNVGAEKEFGSNTDRTKDALYKEVATAVFGDEFKLNNI